MNRLVLFSFLMIAILPVYSQYNGGNDDGFTAQSFAAEPLYDQVSYCSGGSDDGFSMLGTGNTMINDQVLYCNGGIDEGFAVTGISAYFFNTAKCFSGGINDGFSHLNSGPTYLCDPSIYLSGGISDGFAGLNSGNTSICNPSFYVSGGNGDGFHQTSFLGYIYYPTAWLGGISDGFSSLYSSILALAPTFFCLGGNNDGAFTLSLPVTYFGNGIWLGVASNSWNNTANWSFSYIPDLSVDVVIPSGKPFYPLITSGNLTINNPGNGPVCHSLTISQGGLIINKTNLYLYGNMTVSGTYQADDPANHQVVVNPVGNLVLKSPGEMRIGNP